MQKIDNIEIKNFKSIRHQKIEGCKRINVFIGYPNVGKSNILEALSLFEIGMINDLDFNKFLRFENYVNLFYNNSIENSIEVSLGDSERIEISIWNKLVQVRSASRKMFFEMQIPLDSHSINSMEHIESASDDYDSLERLQVKKYSFSEIKNLYPIDFSKELISPYGENLAQVINSNQELKKNVIALFKEYNLKYATDENNNIKIVKEYKDQEVKILPYMQIADTLQRLIFFKAAIVSNHSSILLFEEPEAHMFPPYISKFTNDIMYDENNNQFFLTTHSPFVLNDLMDNLKSDELAIYIVTYKKETGETEIHRMNEQNMHEAYQFGYDFFMNIDKFISQEQYD